MKDNNLIWQPNMLNIVQDEPVNKAMRQQSFDMQIKGSLCDSNGSNSSLILSKNANKVYNKRLKHYSRINSIQNLPAIPNLEGLQSG